MLVLNDYYNSSPVVLKLWHDYSCREKLLSCQTNILHSGSVRGFQVGPGKQKDSSEVTLDREAHRRSSTFPFLIHNYIVSRTHNYQ